MGTPRPAPRVGISSCLLGEKVRYDGCDKLQPLLVELIGPHVEWLAVCPEVEVGMGLPREPVRLEPRAGGDRPRMIGTASRRDWTDAMRSYAAERLADLAAEGLSGYVLKSRSPSCGLAATLFEPGENEPLAGLTEQGLFAAELLSRLPGLPVVEEGELTTPEECVEFLALVWRYHGGNASRAGRGRGLSGTTSESSD